MIAADADGVVARHILRTETDDVGDDEQLASEWEGLIGCARKWLNAVRRDWIKANKRVQAEYPLNRRHGIVPNSLIRASLPNIYRLDKELGKAIPYAVYDLGRNEGWVNVGIDRDTAEFAVESIRRWWRTMGSKVYPKAAELLITADAGGSNAARSRAWKVELQKLADHTGLAIHVCHFPMAAHIAT